MGSVLYKMHIHFIKQLLSSFVLEVFIVNLHPELLMSSIKVMFLSEFPCGYLLVHKPITLQGKVVTYTQEAKDKTAVHETSLEKRSMR